MVSKKKATIKETQALTGILNFLSRVIVPGWVFTYCMYAKLKITDKSGNKLKPHYHVNLGKEFKTDCKVWMEFLSSSDENVLCRPFLDLEMFKTLQELNFYTDALGKIGYGCFFNGSWTCGHWSSKLLAMEPSIEFLELFALCVAIITWENRRKDMRTIIFCDNQAVVTMVNNTTSGCSACIKLLQILVLNNLQYNRRISVCYVKSSENILAESLSREKWDTFLAFTPKNTKQLPDEVPLLLLPPENFLSCSLYARRKNNLRRNQPHQECLQY